MDEQYHRWINIILHTGIERQRAWKPEIKNERMKHRNMDEWMDGRTDGLTEGGMDGFYECYGWMPLNGY